MLWPRTRVPPRNVQALAVTAAASIFLVGLLYWTNRDCLDLVVASSSEKSDLLREIAAEYKRSDPRVDRRCVNVVVIEVRSGDAEAALAQDWTSRADQRPHVWSPAANSWVLLLRQHRTETGRADILPENPPLLMQSPLVIAMPEPMAAVLGQSASATGWKDLLALTRDPAGWGRYGRPEWGPIRFGNTKPTSSTSGLHALIAIYTAAAGGSLVSADVRRDEVRTLVCSFYSRAVHVTDSAGDFLQSLAEADKSGVSAALAYASGIAVEEKQVFEYNRGNPGSDYPATHLRTPNVMLTAIYPTEGALVADHPYVVLNASWVNSAAKIAASSFLTYLQSDPVQQRFKRAGFRDHSGQPGPEIAPPHFDPRQPTQAGRPGAAVLADVQRSWSELSGCVSARST